MTIMFHFKICLLDSNCIPITIQKLAQNGKENILPSCGWRRLVLGRLTWVK